MTSTAISLCSVLALGLGLSLPFVRAVDEVPAAPQSSATASPNQRIGVVNMYTVRKASRWARDQFDQVEKQAMQDKKVLEGLVAEREKLTQRLGLLDPDSRDAQLLDIDYGILQTRLKNQGQLYGALRERSIAEVLVLIRERAQKAVEKIAAERGLDLVLQQSEVPENGSLGERFSLLRGQIVMYAKGELDLSEDVAKLLDAGLGAPTDAAASKDGDAAKKDGETKRD
ncbi:MAG TPA: OmpH family outer membrane protein [Planctomycetota bacterium]|nr:OmpH family outer membrane protein [Planctomycetota bacterium]